MTAIPGRRRRRTIAGAVAVVVLVGLASVLSVIGVLTLRNSREGEAVGVDDRPVVSLPATPNALVAVADDEGRLTSLAVMTLLPGGLGGSIVTIPVNADASAGFGANRQPLNTVFAADAPDAFGEVVEAMLSVAIERVLVLDPDALREVIDPLAPLDVDLPEDVIDSDTFGSGIVADAGPRELRASLAVEAMTAIDTSGAAIDHHDVDVELWSAIGRAAPVPDAPEEPPTDDLGRPLAPSSPDELLERLLSGDVQVRDLALLPVTDNPTGVDVVLLDRRDVLLVFAQVSPALVATPNQALTFRIEAPFTDRQLEASDGIFETTSELNRRLIGELLFFQGNIVSIDATPAEAGAATVTRIEVADERFVDDMREFAPLMFGESEVTVAPIVLDGVDAVVHLGTGYIDLKVAEAAGTVDPDE